MRISLMSFFELLEIQHVNSGPHNCNDLEAGSSVPSSTSRLPADTSQKASPLKADMLTLVDLVLRQAPKPVLIARQRVIYASPDQAPQSTRLLEKVFFYIEKERKYLSLSSNLICRN